MTVSEFTIVFYKFFPITFSQIPGGVFSAKRSFVDLYPWSQGIDFFVCDLKWLTCVVSPQKLLNIDCRVVRELVEKHVIKIITAFQHKPPFPLKETSSSIVIIKKDENHGKLTTILP